MLTEVNICNLKEQSKSYNSGFKSKRTEDDNYTLLETLPTHQSHLN